MKINPPFETEISQFAWTSRYRFSPSEGAAEAGPGDTWERVATACASAEPHNRTSWQQKFTDLLAGLEFIPGGRILAGAGTGRRVTLCNCFVMGELRDDMSAIFQGLREGAVTLQQGGGIGYDFSPLRPEGARAAATGNTASGPVSFMKVWDAMCASICSTGLRRGAMMATLRCDHPDILQFVRAKADRHSLSHFNCSVLVSDAFIRAVREDRPWQLEFAGETASTLPARELWREINQQAYSGSEPGMLFIDQINRENNLWYCERLSATNPCGEVPLPPYGVCNLGSFNLTQFVRAAFSTDARFDFDALADRVPTAVRLLDNVLDLTHYPLSQQRDQARRSRRIGLGFMGLGSALMMLGLHYDSEIARSTAAEIMRTIRDAAYHASAELAVQRGSFPQYQQAEFLAGPYVQRLPEKLRQMIARNGLRNSHLSAVAPTGTISLLANNVSSGIEPVFQLAYQREIRTGEETLRRLDVEDYAYRKWRGQVGGAAATPPEFVTAHELAPQAHLLMQAAVQPLVDQAISKTINLPESLPLEAFQQVYLDAHQMGLKGVTVFRPSPARQGVMVAQSG